MPQITIIIAAFNVERYIEHALRSTLAQTVRDIEIIVVDDASNDGTRDVVARFAAADSRIRLMALAHNGGVADARNHALEAARGAWIAVLDADDWMAEDRLARLLAAAEETGADWIADDLFLMREGEDAPVARLMARERAGAHRISGAHLVRRDVPQHLGYSLLKPMFRKSFLDRHAIRYRAGLRHSEDFLIDIDCAAAGATLALLNEPLYHYLFRAGQITSLDPVNVLASMAVTNDIARKAARAKGETALEDALVKRADLIARDLRYYRSVVPWKEGRRAKALLHLAADPGLWPLMARRLFIRALYALEKRDRIGLILLDGAPSLAGASRR